MTGQVVTREVLLEVKDLHTHFFTDEGLVKAVDGATLTVRRGQTLCVVGESGCGKSITARSILQIVDSPGRIVGGEVWLQGAETRVNLATLDPKGKEIRSVRGKEIAMIFQEPMSALSPVHTVGNQLTEAITLHLPMSRADARAYAAEMLHKVGIPKAETRLESYPFQLSGGMRQRVCIAMALCCKPSLLIADEPTTALDVTTQANILDLIKGLQDELGMAVMFITHDLGVVAEIADEVAVMYLGKVVERGDVRSVFRDPKHPYTQALLESIPKLGLRGQERLASIQGMVPHPFNRPAGCPFHPRCDHAMPGVCNRFEPPSLRVGEAREVRCLLYGGAPEIDGSAPQEFA